MTSRCLSLRLLLFLLTVLFTNTNAQESEPSSSKIGPQIIGETLVGYDENRLQEHLGKPTFISANSSSKTYKYAWTKITRIDGTVLFDGQGLPGEAPSEDALIIQCQHEFDIHISGLITGWSSRGACQDPAANLDANAKRELERLSATQPQVRYDSPDSLNRIALNLSQYFASDELEEYHEYFEKLTHSKDLLVNGRSPLEGIEFQLRNTFMAHNSWKRYLERIRNWKQQKPDSIAVGLLESFYWEAYAWHARGTGMSGSVSETGAKLFRERIEKAFIALEEIKDFGSQNPLWYAHRISLMLYRSMPKQTILEFSEEAVRKFPNYMSIRFSTINALSPRWGGSFLLIDNYVETQMDIPSDEGVEALYTRLYWSASSYIRPPNSVFTATSADWHKMHEGFQKLETLYPISFWITQNFAAFSCKAKDKATYQRLRPKFENFVHPHAWRPPYNLDTCDFELLTEI